MLDQLRKREDRPVRSAILPSSTLNETIAAVTGILGRDLDRIAIERAVIGLFFTGVKLTGGPGIAPGIAVGTPALEKPSGRKP
jgi:hypothetical protein